MRGAALVICAVLIVSARQAPAAEFAADTFVRDDIVTQPVPGNFSVCHGGSCAVVSQVRLDEEQWRHVVAAFAGPARDAAGERARLAEALARFESVVGTMTDTADDRAGNQRGRNWWGQMDCIDESINSTTYLRILAGAALLRWHRVEARVTRGFFLFGWPHTTAVVSETGNGAKWAVDSWFHENGRRPEVVPLELWKTGWRPANVKMRPPLRADELR